MERGYDIFIRFLICVANLDESATFYSVQGSLKVSFEIKDEATIQFFSDFAVVQYQICRFLQFVFSHL